MCGSAHDCECMVDGSNAMAALWGLLLLLGVLLCVSFTSQTIPPSSCGWCWLQLPVILWLPHCDLRLMIWPVESHHPTHDRGRRDDHTSHLLYMWGQSRGSSSRDRGAIFPQFSVGEPPPPQIYYNTMLMHALDAFQMHYYYGSVYISSPTSLLRNLRNVPASIPTSWTHKQNLAPQHQLNRYRYLCWVCVSVYTSPSHAPTLTPQYTIVPSIPFSVVPDLPLPGLTVSPPHCDHRLMHCRLLSHPTVCVVEEHSYWGYFNSISCAM